MKILSVTAQKPHSTGSGIYLTELVRSFARQGHKQAVVCGIFRDDKVEFPDGVACYPVYFSYRQENAGQDNALPFPVVGMSDVMPYESTLYRDLTPEMICQFEDVFINKIRKAVSELDPDIIICHHLFLLTAMVRKHFPDRIVTGLSHGSDLRQMVKCAYLKDDIAPLIAGLDRIFALHDEHKERIINIFGISEDRITIIGSGYNDKLFHAGPRHPRSEIEEIARPMEVPVMLCYAGKMSKSKGVPEFLTALKKLNDDPDVPLIEVTLCGGCQDPDVREIIDSMPENIHWMGQISQDMLADVFRYNDIFVLPSYYEGLPLVLIEAMASGAIPVSTDLPGVRPWVDSNIPDHNIRFIPMPEMATIEQPTDAGRISFTEDLYSALKELILQIKSGELPDHLPDTGSITWDGVASRILKAIASGK